MIVTVIVDYRDSNYHTVMRSHVLLFRFTAATTLSQTLLLNSQILSKCTLLSCTLTSHEQHYRSVIIVRLRDITGYQKMGPGTVFHYYGIIITPRIPCCWFMWITLPDVQLSIPPLIYFNPTWFFHH